MPKFAIQIAYDGTDFCGWQIQKGVGKHLNKKPSIEGTITDAIGTLCGEKVTVISSGRTDAGVHASGQVAHFVLENCDIPVTNLLPGINRLLPDAIEIHQLAEVPDEFRAQRTSRKQYSYYFQQGPADVPQLKRYTMWNRRTLDVVLINQALKYIVGRHDFFSFCSSGAKVSSTIREIFEAEATITPIPGPGLFDPDLQYLIRIRLVGSGFLKQMVRGIAGTLKQIGEKRRPPEDIIKILESRSRDFVGPTAHASGLWLDKVWYPPQEGIEFLNQCPRQPKM
ncbi:MAG: tRNA pseudouridine(38-40) synthase TruA [Verrucomicrobiales bacterium]|nr:tRNA pseudouridine(38-40) synthase TruA [Verrucomicrobiales bacterium]